MTRPIIDFHCHIADTMCFPPSFRDGVVANMELALRAKGVPIPREKVARMHDGTLNDPSCDELVAQMDEAGIDEAVLLVPDFTYALRDGSHTIEEILEHHKKVVDHYPGRFRVFAGVDPRWGADGLALFERSITEFGFDGLKLYPPCGYRLSDDILYPFYELCAQYGLPVLTHIGATSPVLDFEAALPIHIDRPARDFPTVDFVLAHGSVHYPDECAMLCNNRPNIYIDVSGFEANGVPGLNALFRKGINHKILFGTDWPIFRLQGRQSDFLTRLLTEEAFPPEMTETERDLFFHGNAARLLGKHKVKNPEKGS
ncbi:amidohydrolase family protein [Actinocorallia sp. B10E7]|uniref:amidohydrolase family protein n=1 Tax=Actinocorallia sp. B10E7 TaxID=3153558 RepID=UPI00325EB7AA